MTMHKALEDLAYALLEKGRFEEYETFFDHLPEEKKEFHMVRHILGMFLNSGGQASADKASLIGGYAVLPYVAERYGLENMLKWRGSHDIDVVIRDRGMENIILNGFEVSESRKSLSLPNKKIVRLEDGVEIDITYPEGGPNGIIPVAGYHFDSDSWRRVRQILLYDVPVSVADLGDLLNMKVRVRTPKGEPRGRDKYDLNFIVGLLEQQGVEPAHLLADIRPEDAPVLWKVLDEPESSKCFVRPSDAYREGIRRQLPRIRK